MIHATRIRDTIDRFDAIWLLHNLSFFIAFSSLIYHADDPESWRNIWDLPLIYIVSPVLLAFIIRVISWWSHFYWLFWKPPVDENVIFYKDKDKKIRLAVGKDKIRTIPVRDITGRYR